MADVTVLMVGGRRCGKSSILAAMESMLVNNPTIDKYVSIKQDSSCNSSDLHMKKNKLVTFISQKQKGAYYLVDFDADTTFRVYTFRVSHPEAWIRDFTVDFVDCPGETFSENARADLKAELEKWKKKATLFLVIVDTPYLMDDSVSVGNFKDVNLTMNIAQMFKDVKRNSGNDFRKIIFVPVKCEKWRNRLNDVAKRLQVYYDEMFQNHCPNWKDLSYSILPVLTAGGIEFGEFSEPQVLSYNGNYDNKTSCCKRQGNSPIVRMYDGSSKILKLNAGESIVKNTEFTDINPGFPKYSWFKNQGNYKPENCDQIAYHVVRFALFYMLVHHSSWRWLTPNKSTLKNMIQNIELHLINDNDTANGIVPFVTHEKRWQQY